MNEKIEVGRIVRGRVSGIQPYGAFIALGEDRQGLIHISEITNGFVKNIHDYLEVGDEVSVKVIAVDDENGKISLSLKEVTEADYHGKNTRHKEYNKDHLEELLASSSQGFNSLKEKLAEWIEESKQKEGLIQKK
jgi:general stress protein 13